MSADFTSSVQNGLFLTQRLFYGKNTATSAPPIPKIEKSPENYLPTSPMVYAVVPDPEAVDNPDVPSYQPYVHGKCDPPALIPLTMLDVGLDVECWLDSAVVTLSGVWRVHCVMMSRKCECLFAMPLNPKDSILGVEVDISGNSYQTPLISMEETKQLKKVAKINNGKFLDYRYYTFKLPKASGGSILSIKVSWSQKLSYVNGEFCLSVPFSFPAFVNPVGSNINKEEWIQLNVNSGIEREVIWRSTSHSLKELRQQDGRLSLLYEAQVPIWSTVDFNFLFTVFSSDMFGGLLQQSPSHRDSYQREMFCLYLYPGMDQKMNVFRKEVVFIIDISGSMRGKPLEEVKGTLFELLSELRPQDSFNIIAFNGEVHLFSSSMELVTKGSLKNATQWINQNLLANGSTDILRPLKQALKLLEESSHSVPLIFLITDGSVDDERDICSFVKRSLSSGGPISPRIYTLGIGLYCNHYFLRMLAHIGRGHYDAAYDTDSISSLMQSLFSKASSIVFANIVLDTIDHHLDSIEMFPTHIPDLSHGSSLIISGRYMGTFPETISLNGILADLSICNVEVKLQKVKGPLLDKVLAKRQIDILTADAWLTGSKELEEKVIKMSKEIGIPSEYTCLILLPCHKEDKEPQLKLIQEISSKNTMQKVGLDVPKFIILGCLRPGFGNLSATTENLPPGSELAKPSQPTELLVKAASSCCGRLLDRFCCMCFIRTCSALNDQCAIAFTQLCSALACFEWISCCCETCDFCECLLN